MRRGVTAALLLFCATLYGGSEITAGGYAPFVETKPSDPAAPGYYFLTGRLMYKPFEDLTLGGDLFFIHGFPEKDGSNLVETGYLLGRGRIVMQYEFPRIKIGTVTYASIADSSGDYSKTITEGFAMLGGFRRDYVHEEIYFAANPFAEFRVNAAAGVNSGSFEVDPVLGSGVIRDTDLFTYGELSYRIFPALKPFAGVFYGDDLNAQDTFDILRFRGGLRGEELFLEKRLHLSYAAYYKREESEPLHEKDRLALYLKGRWNFASDTDLFGWFYHEYAVAPVRYVSRSVTLQVRQWLFDRKLALSAGGMLLIEKHLGGDWYLPVWPFFEIRSTPVTGLDLLARLHLKFDEQFTASAKWQYRLFQTRLEAGGGYLITGIVQPQVFFFMNAIEGRTAPDSLGMKCMVSVFF